MNLHFEQHGLTVDLPVPEPVEQDGVWYEATEFRKTKSYEASCDILGGSFDLGKHKESWEMPRWIMRPIPRATPEQLKAIGKRERDDRPVEVKEGDCVWIEYSPAKYGPSNQVVGCGLIGKYRWVLEDVAVENEPASEIDKLNGVIKCRGCIHFKRLDGDYEYCDIATTSPCKRENIKPEVKEPAHMSCVGCRHAIMNKSRDWSLNTCDTCFPEMDYGQIRKNWKAKVENEPAHTCVVCGDVLDMTALCKCARGHLSKLSDYTPASDAEDRLRDGPVSPPPLPLRNENKLCRDCGNRRGCDSYKYGRKMACSDFGFVKEKISTPAPVQDEPRYTVEQIAYYCSRMMFNTDDGENNILAQLNDPQDGIETMTKRKENRK